MKTMLKKVISLLLVLSMCMSFFVLPVWAAEEEPEAEAAAPVSASSTTAPKDYEPRNEYIDEAVPIMSLAEDGGKNAKVLLVEDVLPWDSLANQRVLAELTQFDKVTTQEFLMVDLSKYGVIVFANDQPFSTYENYARFKEYMELFASIGGVIVFGACDAGWSNGELIEKLPGDVGKKTHFVATNYIADATHPIVTGQLTDKKVLQDEDLYSNWCSHVSFDESSLPAGTKIILRESDSKRPTLVEYPLGKGRVIASGLTWEHNMYHNGYGKFAEKAMDDMFQYAIRVSSISVDDLAILQERYVQNNAHHIIVADQNNISIKNATITIDGKTYTTDKNGEVIYTGPYGVKQITITAKGYRENVQYYNLQPQQFRCVYLEKDKNDGKPYVTMVTEPSTYYDLRIQNKRFQVDSTATLKLKVTANWNGKAPGKYVIYQDFSNKTIESTDGNFSFSPGKTFTTKGLIWLKLVSANGAQSETVKLNIYMDPKPTANAGNAGGALEDMTALKIADDKKGTVSDSKVTALFPGNFELKISSLPVEMKKEVGDDGTITYMGTIGIGKSNYLDDESKWHTFVDDFEQATKNTDRANRLLDQIQAFGAKSGSFTVEKKLINPELQSVGYIKVVQDKNGNTLEQSGGVIVKGGNTSKLTNQFMAGPIPIYIDLTGKVGFEIQFGLGYDFTKESWKIDGELGVSAEIAVGGGLGVSGVATVGAEGSAGLDIKILPKCTGKAVFKANITAYLLFVFDWKYNIATKEVPLWGFDNAKNMMMAMALDRDAGSLSLADREYASQTTEWFGTAVSPFAFGDAPESIHMLQDYVMPNTLPELVEVGGKHILLFHTDKADRVTGNNVVLMYSVYDDVTDTWGEPQPVCEGISSDLYMKPFVIEDELYVVWQKISDTIAADDANVLLGQMTERIDVSFAKWNKETESFEQSYVNSDDKLDMYPQLVVSGDKKSVVWVVNSENDATGSSGTYGFYVSDYADGAWSAPKKVYETDTYVSELAAGYVNGKLEILYAANALEGASDIFRITGNSAQLVSGEDYVGNALTYENEKFYWAAGGKIAQYDAAKNTITEIKSGREEAILASYRIVDNGTDTAIVWLGSSQETGSVIYASLKNGEAWSNPVALYEPEYAIQYMDVTYEENGDWNIVCTIKEDPEDSKVSLLHVNIREVENTTLEYVDIDETKRVEGIQPVSCKIKNGGQQLLEKVNILVTDKSGKVYYDAEQACAIDAGEQDLITFDLDLSDIKKHTELEVSVTAAKEKDDSDNTQSCEVGFVDVSLDVTQYTVGDKIVFAATVNNAADIPANVTISIIEDSDDGLVLDMRNIGTLQQGSSYVHMFSLDRYAIDFGGEDHKYYYIMVDTAQPDRIVSDNKEIVALYAAFAQPESNTITAGHTATFSVDAEDAVSYKWQYRRNEERAWVNTTLSGYNTNTLTVPALLSRDGYQYRCRITTSNGTVVYTDPATMIVEDSIIISQQPSRQIINVGTDATFHVEAEGEGLTYQWLYRKNAEGSWMKTTMSGCETDTLTVPALLSRNGYQYCCAITDVNGIKVNSSVATLSSIGFTSHPEDQTAAVGTDAIFAVTAAGQELRYQWQYRKNEEGSWMSTTLPGNDTKRLAVPATDNKHGYQYRCRITDALGVVVYSEPATLTICAEIIQHPVDRTTPIGFDSIFVVGATGNSLTYQWQYRKNEEDGWKTTNLPGFDTNTLTVTAIASRAGYQYRCVVTDVNNVRVISQHATLRIDSALTIHTQPENQRLTVGTEAVFDIVATGEDLIYQWQCRKYGTEDWADTDLPGAKTSALAFIVEETLHDLEFRCVITDSAGNQLYTAAALLTVTMDITAQPENRTAAIGEDALFTVGATGVGLVYQWQYRKNAEGSWMSTTLPGAKTATLTVAASEARNGYQYRCRIVDGTGVTAYTEFATLIVGIKFTAQPADQTVYMNEDALFSVETTGVGLSYQWQYRKNEESGWMSTTLPGAKTNILTVTAVEARYGYQYRCRVTDANGAIQYSDYATLSISAQIVQQPVDQTVPVSFEAVFTTKATGVGLTYKWQYRKSAEGSWMSTSMTGFDTDTLTVGATESRSGYQYRCIITDIKGEKLTSDAVTMTVDTALAIHSQPENQVLTAGAEAVFGTVATGIGVKYQWQIREAAAENWSNTDLPGANTNNLTVVVDAALHNYAFRCCVTDSQGVTLYTEPATLTVNMAITVQPVDITAAIGEDALFTVGAAGVGLTYQWQYRKSAESSWMSTTLTGAKTDTLTVNAVESRNGYQYRCKVTDALGTVVYTDAAKLIIGIGINLQPVDIAAVIGEDALFTVEATGIGLTYQWQYRKNAESSWMSTSLPGFDTAALTVAATQGRNGYQYRCRITDTNGKTVITEEATLIIISE